MGTGPDDTSADATEVAARLGLAPWYPGATAPALALLPARRSPLRDAVAGLLGFDPVAGPVAVPDDGEPLACARTVPARGHGPLDGLEVPARRPVALRLPTGAELLVSTHGVPLAYRVDLAGAPVVVCATGQLLWELAGRRPGAFGRPSAPAAATAHPVPEVVDAGVWELPPPPCGDVDDPAFVRAAARAARLLPTEVHDALVGFADDSHPSGALLLRGAPTGPLPPTPARPVDVPAAKADRTSEFALLTVARRLGHPVGFAPELGGRVVQDIVPTRAGADRQVSTSSSVSLDWHTEAAFHPHRPRYLVLLCLRGDPDAVTLLSSVRHLARQLDPDTVAVLREPRFTTMVDESYLGSRPTRSSLPRPVLGGPHGCESLCFDADLMDGADPAARDALAALRGAVEEHHTGVCLQPGDLLVVDNDVAVHGRTAFSPRFDGTDRWLQRSFVVADLTPSAGERTGRVVDTWFLP